MAQKYPAGSLKYERPSSIESRTAFQTLSVEWDNVLTGKALAKFRGRFIVPGLKEFSEKQRLLDNQMRKIGAA